MLDWLSWRTSLTQRRTLPDFGFLLLLLYLAWSDQNPHFYKYHFEMAVEVDQWDCRFPKLFPVCEFVQSMVLNCISSVIDRTFFGGWHYCVFCILCHIIFVFLHLCILYLCRQRPLALLSPVIDPTLPGNSGDCLPLGPQQSTALVKYEDNCTNTQI